jgi:nucleoid DNA-binding protein
VLIPAIDAIRLIQPTAPCPRCGGELHYDLVKGWPLAIPKDVKWCGGCPGCEAYFDEVLPPPPALDTIIALSADERDALAAWIAAFDRDRAEVTARLVEGHAVETSLGVFYTIEHKGYEGRNPRTGAVVPVEPTRTIHFTPAPVKKAQKQQVQVALTALHDAVEERLRTGGVAHIPGIGAFQREAGTVTFEPSPALKNTVNGRD